MKNLCMAGGVALNCVSNGRVLRAGHFSGVWVQPATGDAAGALGAALAVCYSHFRQPRTAPRKPDSMAGAFLGPAYSDDEIESRLRAVGACFERLCMSGIIDRAVDALTQKQALGWFQGRMEFGPRALGAPFDTGRCKGS